MYTIFHRAHFSEIKVNYKSERLEQKSRKPFTVLLDVRGRLGLPLYKMADFFYESDFDLEITKLWK